MAYRFPPRSTRITRNTPVGSPRTKRGGFRESGQGRCGALMRCIRLVHLLSAAGGEGRSYDQLCRAVRVSPKTLCRDLAALRHNGFEIEQNHHGGGGEDRYAVFVLTRNPFVEAR
jgi:hypothetical protein